MYWSYLLRKQIETGEKKNHQESNYTVKQKAVVACGGNRVADRLLFACVHVCAWGGRGAWGIGHAKKGVLQQYTAPFPVFRRPARRRRC